MLLIQHRVPWFSLTPRVSAGSQLVLLWSLTAMVVELAYTGNLLACLVAVEYEPPIDTFDVRGDLVLQ